MKVGGEVSDMIKEDAEQHIKEHQEILIDENLEEEQLKWGFIYDCSNFSPSPSLEEYVQRVWNFKKMKSMYFTHAITPDLEPLLKLFDEAKRKQYVLVLFT